ncbi:MAG: ATP-binding protein [Anaerolineae bacterium]|nr:ATP-binding protein [Anaerolineae bacterium]
MNLIEFTGARRIPLIGRQDLLKETEWYIGRGGFHLLYFEGEGGIGKTALLGAILEQSQRGGGADRLAGCRVAKEVIDLYHVDVHTAEGLIRRIIQVLGEWSFGQSQETLSTLERARAAGDMDTASEQAKRLGAIFHDEFKALTEDGVVLAFDTLEVLEYERDPFQESLNGDMPIPSAGEWLLKYFFSVLRGNIVVLLAGRPGRLKQRLEAAREQNPYLLLQHTLLGALSEEETRDYLKTVAQAEGNQGDGDAAARLWAFGEERSDVVHLLTGGRPILLALVSDMVGHGWMLPPAFGHTLDELQQRSIEAWRREMEQALVVRIQESPTPIGDTIRALAWLRKGATPELLARVMDLKTSGGAWDVYTATGYLDQVAQLALVKVRPGDRRVFLHDEMYALLEKHILLKYSDEQKGCVYDSIREYYRNLTRDLKRRIEQLVPVAVSLHARLRQAFVEEMHYRLRHSPPMGFAMYFWLAEEALGARDTEMDMLLRTEFLRTIGLLKSSDVFAGFVPLEAEVDTAVRWGMRALFLRGDPDEALSIFDEVRRKWGKEAGTLGLAWTHAQLYRAVAKIKRARGKDWLEARPLLATVEEKADEILRTLPENQVIKGRRWQARVLKGLALNYEGYLDRQQGRHLEAVEHYQGSAMLQRRLEMAGLVLTLTNLAYAMALTGQCTHARLLAEEGERLAQRSSQEYMLALTLNVRALVELYDDHHRTALSYTDRALEAASELPTFRAQGLIYLTRAKAHRYLWDSLTEAERQREPGTFDEMLKEATQAANLLRNSPVDRVDALLERGCVYREMARARYQQGRSKETKELIGKSRRDLERATTLAGAIGLVGQQALALTNLGWLWYYVGQAEEVPDLLEQVKLLLPEEYLFPAKGSIPPMAQDESKSEATLPYWSTLGKVEMLKAYLALDQVLAASDRRERESALRTAVRHISLSLAYDELVADEYFDLTRAEEGLHKRTLHDNLSIRMLHKYARQAAEEQGLKRPTRYQQFLNRMFGPPDLWV